MKKSFSRYEVFLVAILAVLQFTIILDFMVLSPLSAILLPELNISTTQFGFVVSAYAWSAGASGLLAAGFADRFDRKKLLLFFYTGFIIGTFLCGIAPTYNLLLIARVVTGIFGGVIGSITYAITTDTFPLEVRGRVMGFLQMAFAGASVLGLPVGLYLANTMGWHAPFLMIVVLCVIVFIVIVVYVKPVNKHLQTKTDRHPVTHLIKTISHPTYAKAFACTVLLTTGGFMLMPFGSAFTVNNLGISIHDLPLMYMITGICAMIASPLIGKLSDNIGKYAVFCICSVLLIGITLVYCNLGVIPLWVAIIISIIMFTNVSGRMVASSALVTAIPDPEDRGAFMSVNSSINMVSGGVASLIAGTIVYQTQTGHFENYDILGYVVAIAAIITMGLMYVIDQIVKKKVASPVV
jgi:predicted MFS family arabinose efflux permease